ncbi:MlaE family ABC transporter permease [Mycobacteroides immunogenum]|uniref:MlaE family ABC transporter permease n=1 Tax=Mycobacteroides immunogenum TaxID=83262 RepID=UPI0006988892|nr:ABC transporter permease [Mycobacteroides immunogenum]ANO02897.1 hypothetical protein BAB75_05370 [Mycobacteroides immunogenum]WJR34758.1 ABC transporter permease [Mycobacteroides immunogenum]
MTTHDERRATTDGVAAIQNWTTGYVKRHPLESLKTVGEQFMLGVRTIQWFFVDLFTGNFQWQEFVRQGAFQAGTAVVPVILVTLPIGVTLSIQFALLAGQVGATSLAGAASGIAIIRQAASLVAALLMSAAVGSAITADLGSRTMREETDAMEVMGVSVIRRLVVPRFDKLSVSLKGDGNGQGPVSDIINAAAGVAYGNGDKIKSGLDELSKALRLSSEGGVTTREQMTSIIKNVSSLFDAAAANDGKLREFSTTIHQLSNIIDDEALGTGTTGRRLNELVKQAGDVLDANRDHIKQSVLNGNTALKTVVDNQRELAETLDVAPLAVENLYNTVDQDNGSFRARFLTDKLLFESQTGKEICNLMGLRQLGCSTGTLQDYGPDFGLTYVLDGLAAMGQK